MYILPYKGGIVVEDGHRVAIDTSGKVPGAHHIVTHAHMDHAGAARYVPVHTTDATSHLLGIRGLNPGVPHRYGEPFLDEVYLLPAGHIPGSSMVYINEGSGVIVTGDFKLERDLISEPIHVEGARVLVMDTTFFDTGHIFPSRRELYATFTNLVKKWIEEEKKVLIFAYNVGKAQEVTALLNSIGITPAVEMEAYRANLLLGLESKGIGREGWQDTHVIILPTSRMKLLKYLRVDPNVRWLYCSGWSKRFPLSSHADYRQSLKFVEMVQPEVIFTYGLNASSAARELKKAGWDAYPLLKPVLI